MTNCSATVTSLEKPPPLESPPDVDAFYMGCWNRIGHYLYDVHGRYAEGRQPKDFPCEPTSLDGGFLKGVPDIEGNAKLTHLSGWTILSFWDRSIDSRGKSSSTFVLRNTHDFAEACRLAQACFPSIWQRYKFAIQAYLAPKD